MGKLKLDLDTVDTEEQLKINTDYAKRYDNWRRLEEIQKLKDRVGDAEDSGSESESSEDLVEWTAEHEKGFLHALAALKTKDPKIYTNEELFQANLPGGTAEESTLNQRKKKRSKRDDPVYLKDYERNLVLEKGGEISEEDDEDLKQKEREPGYFEQQEKLKKELKMALDSQDNAEEDTDSLLRRREKTQSEIEKEEDEYYQWLKGREKSDKGKFENLKGLRELWSSDKLESDEKFLRDFLLNKKYEVENDERIPSYDEIVKVSDDEKEWEREQEFEQKFNFRFEEPDKEFIKQYPRTIKESLRKVGEKRKEKREAHKERKTVEKRSKKEEIRELKALKKKEIEAKLEKLKKMAGEEININLDDLEADFDPAKYDKRMQELFDTEYYEKADEDEEKPSFSEISEASDDESDYDELALPSTANEKEANGEKGEVEEKLYRDKAPTGRKKKRNSRFMSAVLKEKPTFNPDEKTFEEYFNEYYALDYEDIIGDTITRFKYRNVPANDFGLTTDEVLSADDRQLNAWVSLKRVTGYRGENEEKYDVKAYAKKAQDLQKKQRILNTDFGGKKSVRLKKEMEEEKNPQVSEIAVASDDSNKLKKRKKKKAKPGDKAVEGEKRDFAKSASTSEGPMKAKRNRKRKLAQQEGRELDASIGVNDDRLRAYGVNPKKYKNKLKWAKRS